jgi:hypothetical protein
VTRGEHDGIQHLGIPVTRETIDSTPEWQIEFSAAGESGWGYATIRYVNGEWSVAIHAPEAIPIDDDDWIELTGYSGPYWSEAEALRAVIGRSHA